MGKNSTGAVRIRSGLSGRDLTRSDALISTVSTVATPLYCAPSLFRPLWDRDRDDPFGSPETVLLTLLL
jgi:hypothetical protein